MKQRPRIYYTESQKALRWERWKKGESLQHISQLFDREHSSVQRILAETVCRLASGLVCAGESTKGGVMGPVSQGGASLALISASSSAMKVVLCRSVSGPPPGMTSPFWS